MPLFFAIVLLSLSGVGLSNLQYSDDAAAAMLPSNQEWIEKYKEFLAEFPGDQVIVVATENLICSSNGWHLFEQMNEDLSDLDFRRTFSLANNSTKVIRGGDQSISIDSLSALDFTASERCAFTSSNDLYTNLYSEGAAPIYLTSDPKNSTTELIASVKGVIEEYDADLAALGAQSYATGEPVLSARISELVRKDTLIVTISFAIMIFLTFCFTSSLAVLVATVFLNIFVLTCTYGVMGWAGVTITPATTLVIFLLIPLSSAFVIHAYWHVNPRTTIRTSFKTAFLAAGFSTAIGFGATGFTPASDIQSMAAMGVVGVLILTIGVWCVVLPILSYQKKQKAPVLRLPSITRIIARPWIGYVVTFAFLAYILIGSANVQFNYKPLGNLRDTDPALIEFDKYSQRFGKFIIPIVIETEGRLTSPIYWRELETLTHKIEQESESVVSFDWLLPKLDNLFLALTGRLDNFQYSEELAQILLFLEPDETSGYLNQTQTLQTIYAHVFFDDSASYLKFKQDVERLAIEAGLTAHFAGRVPAFFETGHRVGKDTMKGLMVSMLIVSIILFVITNSIWLTGAGILTNILPIGVGVATLGLLGVTIELGSAIVSAIAFGIVLDDSMHLITRVKDLVRSGFDPSTAVNQAVNDMLAPIVTTTTVIAVGMAVLYLTDLTQFRDFATLILVTLCAALVTELTILPTWVAKFYRDPISSQ